MVSFIYFLNRFCLIMSEYNKHTKNNMTTCLTWICTRRRDREGRNRTYSPPISLFGRIQSGGWILIHPPSPQSGWHQPKSKYPSPPLQSNQSLLDNWHPRIIHEYELWRERLWIHTGQSELWIESISKDKKVRWVSSSEYRYGLIWVTHADRNGVFSFDGSQPRVSCVNQVILPFPDSWTKFACVWLHWLPWAANSKKCFPFSFHAAREDNRINWRTNLSSEKIIPDCSIR